MTAVLEAGDFSIGEVVAVVVGRGVGQIVDVGEILLELRAHRIFTIDQQVIAPQDVPVLLLACDAERGVRRDTGASAEADHGLMAIVGIHRKLCAGYGYRADNLPVTTMCCVRGASSMS